MSLKFVLYAALCGRYLFCAIATPVAWLARPFLESLTKRGDGPPAAPDALASGQSHWPSAKIVLRRSPIQRQESARPLYERFSKQGNRLFKLSLAAASLSLAPIPVGEIMPCVRRSSRTR